MQYMNQDGFYVLRSPCEKHTIEIEFWSGTLANNEYVTIKVDGEPVKTSFNSKAIHFRLTKEEQKEPMKGVS